MTGLYESKLAWMVGLGATGALLFVSGPSWAQANAGDAPSPVVALPQKAKVKVDPVAVKMRNDKARQAYLLGRHHYANKKYGEALKAFRQAYEGERLPDLLFEIAACHARMGKMRKAFALHRRYVDSFRDPIDRLVAAARFGRIMKDVRQAAKAKTVKMAKQPASP